MDIDAANFAKLSDENARLAAAIEDLERENHSLQTKVRFIQRSMSEGEYCDFQWGGFWKGEKSIG